MSKKEKTIETPPLPGIDIKPLRLNRVQVYKSGVVVEYDRYLLTRPLTSEEAQKLHDESRLPALKEAREILDREIEKMERGG